MNSIRGRSYTAPVAFLLLTFALTLPAYVWTYFKLVTPGDYTCRAQIGHVYWPRNYRSNETVAGYVFWPLEKLDRALRPKKWKVPPNATGEVEGRGQEESSGHRPLRPPLVSRSL